MIRFSTDKVKLLYRLMIEETGGTYGLRDEELLDSALNGIFQTFDGADLYPTKEEKAARLGYSLIANHAFVDGNKRTGAYLMLTFLEVNGIRVECTDEELTEIILAVASSEKGYEELLEWIKEHSIDGETPSSSERRNI